jgi:two-component sensor histidine kinase
MDRMVPLALVINELLTNAFKYAFPGDRTGTIHVEASHAEGEVMLIDVWDDGVGIDNARKSEGGIGTILIEALTSQLGAGIERIRRDEPGTGWRLSIPPKPDKSDRIISRPRLP